MTTNLSVRIFLAALDRNLRFPTGSMKQNFHKPPVKIGARSQF
jgi:hypothetical protein